MNIKDSYNLVFFGDSITKGVVFDSEKYKYSTIKDSFTNIVASSIKGTVYNAGKFGSTVIRGVSKMYNDVMKKTPDIVVIEFGGNDCDFNWDDIAQSPETEHQPNTDISIFRETLLKMIDTLNEANIMPALMTLPPLDSKRYFKWVTKGDPIAEKNVLRWLGSEEEIYYWHNSYNEMVVDVANKSQTTLIDVRSAFLDYPDYSQLLCTDGIHPNAKGHSVIAKVFLNYFQNNCNFILQKR